MSTASMPMGGGSAPETANEEEEDETEDGEDGGVAGCDGRGEDEGDHGVSVFDTFFVRAFAGACLSSEMTLPSLKVTTRWA